jgi:hypothetical protein
MGNERVIYIRASDYPQVPWLGELYHYHARFVLILVGALYLNDKQLLKMKSASWAYLVTWYTLDTAVKWTEYFHLVRTLQNAQLFPISPNGVVTQWYSTVLFPYPHT